MDSISCRQLFQAWQQLIERHDLSIFCVVDTAIPYDGGLMFEKKSAVGPTMPDRRLITFVRTEFRTRFGVEVEGWALLSHSVNDLSNAIEYFHIIEDVGHPGLCLVQEPGLSVMFLHPTIYRPLFRKLESE